MSNFVRCQLGFELDDQEQYLSNAGSIYTKARNFASGFPGFPIDSYSNFETRDNNRGRFAHVKLLLIVDDMSEAATVEGQIKTALEELPPLIPGDKGYKFEYESDTPPEE